MTQIYDQHKIILSHLAEFFIDLVFQSLFVCVNKLASILPICLTPLWASRLDIKKDFFEPFTLAPLSDVVTALYK